MLFDNLSCQRNQQRNYSSYCDPLINKKEINSLNFGHTEKSYQKPSSIDHNLFAKYQNQLLPRQSLANIKQIGVLQTLNQKTHQQTKKMQAIQRNINISTILSVVLAFSERIQSLKQKLCGYPAQNFFPARFFEILDITEKGQVDIYDIKRFINNEKIRQKDIILLFKRLNGDHSQDNTKLTYFGYLNMIKPYFNDSLARDLLERETAIKRSKKRVQNDPQYKIQSQILESTEQSVLLLFQQLVLLHCICTSQHEQAKELLMNDYMLNLIQLKNIIGFDCSDSISYINSSSYNSIKATTEGMKKKSGFILLHEFLRNNCEFDIQFSQMKYLLSFLNCHEFSLTNDKYLSLLLLPTNCNQQLSKQLQRKKQSIPEYQDAKNYMKTFLAKNDLIYKGNTQNIKDCLDQKALHSLSGNHAHFMVNSQGRASQANFLQIVHPRSLQKVVSSPKNFKVNSKPLINQSQSARYQNLPNEHPKFEINQSNKCLSSNINTDKYQMKLSILPERKSLYNSNLIKQNIRVISPRQISQAYINNYSRDGLQDEFYQSQKQQLVRIQKIPGISFLQKFMKKSNLLDNYRGQSFSKYQPANIINEKNSCNQSSSLNNDAFEVVEYDYNQKKSNQENTDQYQSKRSVSHNQKLNNPTFQSREKIIGSQQKDKNLNRILSSNEKSYSDNNYANSVKRQQNNFQKSKIESYHINQIGLSQSSIVNQSNILRNFYTKGADKSVNVIGDQNILNDFFKKRV